MTGGHFCIATPEQQREIVSLVEKILAAKEKEQTDLFASNDAHNKKVKGVSPEQIRLLSKNRKRDFSTCDRGDTAAADTSGLEKQIDTLVYKLYGLSFDEAKVIDPELTVISN